MKPSNFFSTVDAVVAITSNGYSSAVHLNFVPSCYTVVHVLLQYFLESAALPAAVSFKLVRSAGSIVALELETLNTRWIMWRTDVAFASRLRFLGDFGL